jgi:hypothetical protein
MATISEENEKIRAKKRDFEKKFEEMDVTEYEKEVYEDAMWEIKDPMKIHRKYYEYKPDGLIEAYIDRTYADEVAIILPCGYFQRLWIDCTDKEALKRVENMKKEGIKSA